MIFYNIMLILLHMASTFFVAAMSVCRVIFHLNWRWVDESFVWSCTLMVYFVHYLLIEWGHRRLFLQKRTLIVLKYWENIIWGILGFLYSGVFVEQLLAKDVNVDEAVLLFLPFVLVMFIIYYIRRRLIKGMKDM